MLSYKGLHFTKPALKLDWVCCVTSEWGIIVWKWHSSLKRDQTLALCPKFLGLSGICNPLPEPQEELLEAGCHRHRP